MATIPGEIAYTEEDGFFIIVDPDSYELPPANWDLSNIVSNLEAHMAKGSAMAVYLEEQQLHPAYDDAIPLVEAPTGDAVVEHTFGLTVTSGTLAFLSYGDLTMAAENQKLPMSGRGAPQLIEIENGDWTFTLRQLNDDEPPAYEVVVTAGKPDHPTTNMPGADQLS